MPDQYLTAPQIRELLVTTVEIMDRNAVPVKRRASGEPVPDSVAREAHTNVCATLAELPDDDPRLVTLASLHPTPESLIDLIEGIPDDGMVPVDVDGLLAYLIQANS